MGSSASPSKELQALLEQANKHLEEERQRAEDERQRADRVEKRFQSSTFAEYLEACHRFISKPLSIQTDRRLTTKGSITNPTGRLCPTSLETWDFREAQQLLFDDVYQLFHPPQTSPPRVFSAVPFVEERGKEACDKPLGSESDLVKHQEAEVERPVKMVIEKLAQLPATQDIFPLLKGISFESHSNMVTEEPGQPQSVNKKPFRADQNCVYLENDNDQRLLYIIEYKAGHKLRDESLCAGLQPMNMQKEVVHNVTIPYDPKEKDLHRSRFLCCAAITQTFDYMIRGGLEYSCLTNGRVKVMLRIREEDPTTLYYCVLEPSKDAEPSPSDNYGFRYPYSAVGYQLGLTLLSLQSDQRSQAWRSDAMGRLNTWDIDFETVLKSIPAEERNRTPPGSSYRGPRYPINPRSPYLFRQRLPRSRSPTWYYHHRDPSPDPSGESDTGQAPTPSSPSQQRRKRQRKSSPSRRTTRTSGQSRYGQSRAPNCQYCTQACLRGLYIQSDLDPRCPNIFSHQKHSGDGRHPLSRRNLVQLVSQQLNRDPDHCCRPLGKRGIHGSLFVVTLDNYGYTFVAKGTEYNSHYEGDIYSMLQRLQGSAIPVYLGDIFLQERVYFLDHFTTIIHMSLIAWGGEPIEDESYPEFEAQIQRTKAEVYEAGVEHLDVRCANLLWNEEMKRIMLIDFGRVNILRRSLKRKQSILSSISPNSKVKAENSTIE